MTPAEENARMGRKVGIAIASLFVTIVIVWSVLITIAINNQPERIEIEPQTEVKR